MTRVTYVNNSEHVGESHVGQDQEDGSVDVHDSLLVVGLSIVNGTQHQGNDLERDIYGTSSFFKD